MIGGEDLPLVVPVNIDAWRWPLRTDGAIGCGECGETLPMERHTELSELAEAVEQHAASCRQS